MLVRKPADQRKTEIVQAALRLAGESGPDAITTERIAAAVGISQPGVFRHFPRKDDIWIAVSDWIGGELQQCWDDAFATGDSPVARLQGIVRRQLGLIQRTPAIPSILLSRELHVGNQGLRAALGRLMERFFAALRVTLDAGIADGTLRADLDVRDAAFAIIALVQGLAVRWSLSEGQFDLVAEGERLLELLIDGISRDDATRKLIPAGRTA